MNAGGNYKHDGCSYLNKSSYMRETPEYLMGTVPAGTVKIS
jgi:hypothetical protein